MQAASARGAAEAQVAMIAAIGHVLNMLHDKGVLPRDESIASLSATASTVESRNGLIAIALRQIAALLELQDSPATSPTVTHIP